MCMCMCMHMCMHMCMYMCMCMCMCMFSTHHVQAVSLLREVAVRLVDTVEDDHLVRVRVRVTSIRFGLREET